MPSFDRTKRALSATHSTTLQAASASSTSSSKSATSPASSPPSGGTPSGIGRDGAVAASGSGAITSVLKGFRLPAGSPSPCQPSSQSLSPGDGDVAPRCAEGAHIEDHIAPLLGVVVPIQHPRFPDIWCPHRVLRVLALRVDDDLRLHRDQQHRALDLLDPARRLLKLRAQPPRQLRLAGVRQQQASS